MIRLLKRKDIVINEWDRCIEHAQQDLPYAYSWVLDLLHPDWQALVMNDYEAVMPLLSEKKWIFNLLRQSPWLQQLGVFSIEPLDQHKFNTFFEAMPSYFHKVYFRLNYTNTSFEQATAFQKTPRTNLILPLEKSYEQLWGGFSKNTKRNIKKAHKFELKLIKDIDVDLLLSIYMKFQAPKQTYHSKKDFQLLPQLLSKIINHQKGFIWGIKNNNGSLIAANFFWQSNRRIISMLPALHPEGRDKSAMFLMMNELIETYSTSNHLLDFEGSSIESIARFNRGFGAVEQNFVEVHQHHFPFNLF